MSAVLSSNLQLILTTDCAQIHVRDGCRKRALARSPPRFCHRFDFWPNGMEGIDISNSHVFCDVAKDQRSLAG